MSTDKGWIKVYRDIWENGIWQRSDPFDMRSAWIDLILLANHENKDVVLGCQIIKIRRGQHLTSIRKLAERWHWSKDRVRRYLALLESMEMIKCATPSATINGTLLTIEKYGLYQDVRDSNKYTNKHSNGTPTGTATGHQQDPNKNDIRMSKNEKEYSAPAPTLEDEDGWDIPDEEFENS